MDTEFDHGVYSDGEKCGYDRGFDEGKDEGYDEGYLEALKVFKDELKYFIERLQ